MSTSAFCAMSSAYRRADCTASEPSSSTRSSTLRPRSPPAAFTCSAQSSSPLWYSPARLACAPDCDTTAPTTTGWACASAAAATRAAAVQSLVIKLVVDGVAPHRDEHRALEGHEDRAVRLLAGGAHRDDAVVRPRLRRALGEHLGLGVDGVA